MIYRAKAFLRGCICWERCLTTDLSVPCYPTRISQTNPPQRKSLVGHVRFPEATTFTFQHVHAYTGWWFQTFFIFHNIWDNPSR